MGRATIISEIGAGQYTIKPVFDTATAAAQIARLTDENTAIDTRLAELATDIGNAQFDFDFASAALHAAFINGDETDSLQDEVNSLVSLLGSLRQSRSLLSLKKTSNIKRSEFLAEQSTQPASISAWCADLTEGATGDVGTIEIGRTSTMPIIKPTAPGHNAADDGQLQPVNLATPAAAFVNLALAPGAAKWRPRFRTGTASNIDTGLDTMDVTLDAVEINGVACDQGLNLTAVPVSYMTCNAAAFSDGDAVVVEFTGQDFTAPLVVGFVDHPQPCSDVWIKLKINGSYCTLGGQKIALRYIDITGTEIITDYQSIPEVGAPLDSNNQVTVPVDNYSLAGPFALVGWDRVSDVDVLLNSELTDINCASWSVTDRFDAVDLHVPARKRLFSYFYEDSGSDVGAVLVEKAEIRLGPRKFSQQHYVDASTPIVWTAAQIGIMYKGGYSGANVGDEVDYVTGYQDGGYTYEKLLTKISMRSFIVARSYSAADFLLAGNRNSGFEPVDPTTGLVVDEINLVDCACQNTIYFNQAEVPPQIFYHHKCRDYWLEAQWSGGEYPDSYTLEGVENQNIFLHNYTFDNEIDGWTFDAVNEWTTRRTDGPFAVYSAIYSQTVFLDDRNMKWRWSPLSAAVLEIGVPWDNGGYAESAFSVDPGPHYPSGGKIEIPITIPENIGTGVFNEVAEFVVNCFGEIAISYLKVRPGDTSHKIIALDPQNFSLTIHGAKQYESDYKTGIDFADFYAAPQISQINTVEINAPEQVYAGFTRDLFVSGETSYMHRAGITTSIKPFSKHDFSGQLPYLMTTENGGLISSGQTYTITRATNAVTLEWSTGGGASGTETIPADNDSFSCVFTPLAIPAGYL